MTKKFSSEHVKLLEFAFRNLAEDTELDVDRSLATTLPEINWITGVSRDETNGAIEIKGKAKDRPLSPVALLTVLQTIPDLKDRNADVIRGNITSVALLAGTALRKLQLEAHAEQRELKKTHLKVVKSTSASIAQNATRALSADSLLDTATIAKARAVNLLTSPNARSIPPNVREWLLEKYQA